MEIPVPVQPSWLRRASAPLPGLSAPGRLFDQRFGEGLLEAELASLCPAALAPYYLRAPSVALPTAQVPSVRRGGNSNTSKARGSGHPGRGEGAGRRGGGGEWPLNLSRVLNPATQGGFWNSESQITERSWQSPLI